MKKTVEMTYCDRCSTEIAPDVLESYEGFDLCRPCAEELRRRIHDFVSELKVPEQPEGEAATRQTEEHQRQRTVGLQKRQRQYQHQSRSLRLSANPSRWSTAAFCISSAPAAALPRPFARRSP